MGNKSKIHFLQVKYGDAFVIECSKGDNRGVVVVDGGPVGCGYVLQNKLNQLGTPDLMVLTHYDKDHIGGIKQVVNTCLEDDKKTAKIVWANCAGYVKMSSDKTTNAKDGVMLSVRLDELAQKHGMIWRNDICEGYSEDFPFASIEVVSPTRSVMGMVIKKQEDEAEKLLKATNVENELLEIALDKLAEHMPSKPNLGEADELANASSIAFILRCDGLSVLMLGDSYPQNVEAYLRQKGYSEDNPLEVDYVKVSHHGSRNNTSNELLDIIKCNHFLISTNGGLNNSNHPDRIAIAHILCHPKRNMDETIHLYFNYGMNVIEANGQAFFKEAEQEKWNFKIHEKVNEI